MHLSPTSKLGYLSFKIRAETTCRSNFSLEPAVLVHYMALIGSIDKVRITHCRWRCRIFVTQRPLSLLMSMIKNCYCL